MGFQAWTSLAAGHTFQRSHSVSIQYIIKHYCSLNANIKKGNSISSKRCLDCTVRRTTAFELLVCQVMAVGGKRENLLYKNVVNNSLRPTPCFGFIPGKCCIPPQERQSAHMCSLAELQLSCWQYSSTLHKSYKRRDLQGTSVTSTCTPESVSIKIGYRRGQGRSPGNEEGRRTQQGVQRLSKLISCGHI